MLRTTRRAVSAVLLVTLGGAVACATHEAKPAFRAGVFIGDRGISIPLPPPSLFDSPQQKVDVEGDVIGADATNGLIVVITDNAGAAETEVPLESGMTAFHAEGLAIDLTDNCLELWVETAEGQQGDHHLYRAVIAASGESVEVEEGCDQ